MAHRREWVICMALVVEPVRVRVEVLELPQLDLSAGPVVALLEWESLKMVALAHQGRETQAETVFLYFITLRRVVVALVPLEQITQVAPLLVMAVLV
jgi:hypothetical protein